MKRWRFWCWLLGEAAGMGAALGYFRLRLMQDDLETDLWLGTGLALGGALGGGLAGAIVGSVVGKIADLLEHEPGVIYWILVLVGAVASVCLGWELHADEQGWQWWTWRAGSAAVGMASAGLLCGLLALARKGR